MESKIAEYSEIKSLAETMARAVKPQKIYLFGSFAKSKQTEDSDYDFCLIVDDGRNVDELSAEAYVAIGFKRKRPVDILVVSDKQFAERKNWNLSVERDVAEEGVLIYG